MDLHFRDSADTDIFHGEAVLCLVLSFYLSADFACEDDEQNISLICSCGTHYFHFITIIL